MKALFSYGTNQHAQLLDLARPSFQAFAKRHGYDYIEARNIQCARPAPWYKIAAMRELLKTYDDVVFVGADCVIVDGREDMGVPFDCWQALVQHQTGDGLVPNTDMWMVRKPMLPILEQVWNNTQWIMHGWWEQASLLDLMGYQVMQPTHPVRRTELMDHTYFLDPGWNVHTWHRPVPARARIQHATMWPDRLAIMAKWAQQAEEWMNE